MNDIGIPNLIREMTESQGDILFVSSINYEKRSLQWMRIANKIILRNQVHKQIHLYRLSLINTGQLISILDEKTRSQEFDFMDHLRLIRNRMEFDQIKGRLHHSIQELLLQDLADPSEIIGDMLKNLTLTEPYQIVFDITALPRRVLLLMMEVFAKMLEIKKASSIYILYTWPARYPVAGRSTNTGSLKVENAKVRLTQFLADTGEIHGLMTAGRDGSIGRLFLESMPTGSKIDTYLHIKKDDYTYALENILENSNVLSYIDNHPSTTLNYYLSISRGYDAIMGRIKSVLRNWNATKIAGLNRALLIAPFGPKPMMITAYIGTRYSELFYKKNSLNYKAGIVHVSSLQQNDLYSIGIKDTSCYKLNIEDLLGQ